MNEITIEQYQDAVVKMCNLAQDDTGGSRVAAQVILSAYNGDFWQLSITDLCLLDLDNFKLAMDVIKGRRTLEIEPHNLVDNGKEIFVDLCSQWERYNVRVRGERLQ